MAFDEGDMVVLHDTHSKYDGEEGTITRVVETMFGDMNYTVEFDEGEEAGIAEDSLDLIEKEE